MLVNLVGIHEVPFICIPYIYFKHCNYLDIIGYEEKERALIRLMI